MKSNEAAFHWLASAHGNAEQRDYPIREESLILAMTDMVFHPPFGRDTMHSHNCMEIGLCLCGEGTIYIEGKAPLPYKTGAVLIIPEGVRHCQQFARQSENRWLYIAADQRRLAREAMPNCRVALARMLSLHGCGVLLGDEAMRSDIAWLIERMFDIKCMAPEEATAELEALVMLILMRISRESAAQELPPRQEPLSHSPIEPALLYIAERYRDEIKVGQLARSCAMSESYFRKIFLQEMGVSPMEYLNRYRIRRAENMLLRRGEMAISHVAEECGFTSMATFNRNFQRYVGQNPTEVKRENAHKRENDADKIVQNG